MIDIVITTTTFSKKIDVKTLEILRQSLCDIFENSDSPEIISKSLKKMGCLAVLLIRF